MHDRRSQYIFIAVRTMVLLVEGVGKMTTPREAKSLSATVVTFCRSDGVDKIGGWETGIAILPYAGTSNVSVIIDLDGKPVEHIWDYRLAQSQGCFTASDVDEFQE